MKNIFKVYILFLVFVLLSQLILSLPRLEIFSKKDLSLRQVRINSAFNFFQANQGNFFSYSEIKNLGFTEQELLHLVSQNKIIEIKTDSQYYENKDYPGNLYLLPRETIISKEFIQSLNQERSSAISEKYIRHFFEDIDSFKQDLEKTINYWKGVYERNIDIGSEKFKNYFIPEILRILGDKLESINSTLNKAIYELDQRLEILAFSGEITQSKVDSLFDEILDKIKENEESREIYAREHNISEELNNIISALKYTIDQNNILGIIVKGSWAHGTPKENSDLDILIISEHELDEIFTKKLYEEISHAILEKAGLQPDLAMHIPLIINQPYTFDRFFIFDGTREYSIYVRNFIIIAKDDSTLEKITSLIF